MIDQNSTVVVIIFGQPFPPASVIGKASYLWLPSSCDTDAIERELLAKEAGVEITKFDPNVSSSDDIIEALVMLEDHHGVYSTDHPFDECLVFGLDMDEEVLRTLKEWGWTERPGNKEYHAFRVDRS